MFVAVLAMPSLLAVTGCGSDYSPNTYAAGAVQQASKVNQGIVVGVRKIDIRVSGTTGAVTGAGVGGIAGSQLGSGAGNAIGSLGGSLVGGLFGTAVEQQAGDTFGYEYIVRKPNADLLSVTQKDETPLAIGTHVLLIEGPQARIVRDYTVPIEPPGSVAPVKPAEAALVKPAEAIPAPAAAAPPPAEAPAAAATPAPAPVPVPAPEAAPPAQ
jgi:outer membrane lipoprotein SlyB